MTCHVIGRLCSLTKRAKYGERAFLDVYHALYEAPDPAAALQTATEMAKRVAELETEIRRQAQELAEYSAESEEIRNQDAILRRLEDKIRSLEMELQAKDTARDVLRKVSTWRRQREMMWPCKLGDRRGTGGGDESTGGDNAEIVGRI